MPFGIFGSVAKKNMIFFRKRINKARALIHGEILHLWVKLCIYNTLYWVEAGNPALKHEFTFAE